ncbi:hypothetical protein Droror1_Dr00023257 [Drosera rotundifolia]
MLLKALPNIKEYLKTLVSFGKVTPEQKEEVTNHGLTVYNWDEFLEMEVGQEYKLPEKKKSDICMIMYNNGTTGDPKGVLIHNGSLVAVIAGLRHHMIAGNIAVCSYFMAFLPVLLLLNYLVELLSALFDQFNTALGLLDFVSGAWLAKEDSFQTHIPTRPKKRRSGSRPSLLLAQCDGSPFNETSSLAKQNRSRSLASKLLPGAKHFLDMPCLAKLVPGEGDGAPAPCFDWRRQHDGLTREIW